MNPPTPTDPHYPFYQALRHGGCVWRNDKLNGVSEILTLQHPDIAGEPAKIQIFGYTDLSLSAPTLQRVYLCGKMRGVPLFNFPAFDAAAKQLRKEGYEVFSPAERDRLDGFDPAKDKEHSIAHYMAIDLPEVCKADLIMVMPGWETSQGANIEIAVGAEIGKQIIDYQTRLPLFTQPKMGVHKLSEDSKPTNPKDAIGSNKIPLHLWPETASVMGAMAMLDGALKYGRSNFRAIGVRASIYYDACRRHITKWFEGEDVDPDSGLHPLAHALACIAIILDAQYAGKLNDDRMYKGGTVALMKEMTPHVERLKKFYAGRNPHHYTKQDKVSQ